MKMNGQSQPLRHLGCEINFGLPLDIARAIGLCVFISLMTILIISAALFGPRKKCTCRLKLLSRGRSMGKGQTVDSPVTPESHGWRKPVEEYSLLKLVSAAIMEQMWNCSDSQISQIARLYSKANYQTSVSGGVSYNDGIDLINQENPSRHSNTESTKN